jgi:hypothetical protein
MTKVSQTEMLECFNALLERYHDDYTPSDSFSKQCTEIHHLISRADDVTRLVGAARAFIKTFDIPESSAPELADYLKADVGYYNCGSRWIIGGEIVAGHEAEQLRVGIHMAISYIGSERYDDAKGVLRAALDYDKTPKEVRE